MGLRRQPFPQHRRLGLGDNQLHEGRRVEIVGQRQSALVVGAWRRVRRTGSGPSSGGGMSVDAAPGRARPPRLQHPREP